MRKIVWGLFIATISVAALAEDGFKPLFNGKDLSGWKTAKNTGAFVVDETEEVIHVYAGKEAGSEQEIDCLYTEKEFGSFILKMEYKWLENRFAPRIEHDRDAGLLFHIHGDLTKMWPHCLEMQLGESDPTKVKSRYVTGDLWVIGKDIQVMNERDGRFYTPGSPLFPVGKGRDYDSSFISAGNEKSHGEWNEIILTVRAGKEAVFELNGKVVNRISDMNHEIDGTLVPLASGRIGLQAEYAELLYRNIRIKELDE